MGNKLARFMGLKLKKFAIWWPFWTGKACLSFVLRGFWKSVGMKGIGWERFWRGSSWVFRIRRMFMRNCCRWFMCFWELIRSLKWICRGLRMFWRSCMRKLWKIWQFLGNFQWKMRRFKGKLGILVCLNSMWKEIWCCFSISFSLFSWQWAWSWRMLNSINKIWGGVWWNIRR